MEYVNKPARASKQSISLWEQFFGLEMPQDLRNILFESNGPIFYDEILDIELQFLGTNDAVDLFSAYGFDEYMADAIPVCLDGSGNFAVYRIKDRSVLGMWATSASNLGWEDAVKVSENVAGLIELRHRLEWFLYD